MDIKLREVTVREVSRGYIDNAEEGVVGYDGRLNIRPKYQREFVYNDKLREDVIRTIYKGFPLNVMYWITSFDGNFEVLDGQQRTISFCQYVNGEFPVVFKDGPMFFHNLTRPEQEKILDYRLMIYFCDGNEKEKLDWFTTINIAGMKLNQQEIRNAIYSGTWLTHAKSIFSKSNCAAYLLAKDYVVGSPIRQDILETAISWISKGNIENYMSNHQNDENANVLWMYFRKVIDWVRLVFNNYRSAMKGVNWGALYDKYNDKMYDVDLLENEVSSLMMDDDVTSKKGIYSYIFSRNENHLNIRSFTATQKQETYEKQDGICKKCEKHFDLKDMEADHIIPWSKGGKTSSENCQMLCQNCNRFKSDN